MYAAFRPKSQIWVQGLQTRHEAEIPVHFVINKVDMN